MKVHSALVPLLSDQESDGEGRGRGSPGGSKRLQRNHSYSNSISYPFIEKLSKRGVFFAFIFFLLIFYISPMYKSITGLCETPLCLPHYRSFWEESAPGFLVYSSSCKIAEMNPFDKSVRPYLKMKGPQVCPKSLVQVASNKFLKYDESHRKYQRSSCCFREIHREAQDPHKYNRNADWSIRLSKNCTAIPKNSEGIEVTSEFFKIECEESAGGGKKYKTVDYQAVVWPPQKHGNATAMKVNFWQQDQIDSTSEVPLWRADLEEEMSEVEKVTNGHVRPPSILVVGIDSISRMHMIRSLPTTKLFLEAHDFIELKGYTKIGENTFPNVMGALAGMRTDKYPCYNRTAWGKLDDCPLIWKNFSRTNYVTAFLEDSPGLAIFNYLKTGFVEQPVDYYLRTLLVAANEKKSHSSGFHGCIGGLSQTNFMLRYMRNFVRTMGEAKVPYFLMSWFTSIAHDDFNALKPADKAFHDLLSDAVTSASYGGNNTLIIFMSDHGYRFGSFRETFLGYYEESLPFFFVRFPPSLKASHPQWYSNLKSNGHRLTSPLDLHATLEDILSLSFPSSNISSPSPSSSSNFTFSHGNWDKEQGFRDVYSFFEDTPVNRTCESSGIPQVFCRCGVTPAISKRSPKSAEFGKLVVDRVNEILSERIQDKTCVQLKLRALIYLRELSEGELWNNFGKLITFKDHILALAANPSNAHFEAKVREFSNGTTTLVGKVSRINSYEGQNDCLKDYALKNYCMCKDYYEKMLLRKKTEEAKKKQKAKQEARKNNKKPARVTSSVSKSTKKVSWSTSAAVNSTAKPSTSQDLPTTTTPNSTRTT